ncbi:MAG: endolytic transglycosylase MltG [Paracoccaceae bacterium]
MWRHIASNALSLFVVILVVIGGVIAWGKVQYSRAGPLTQAICLQVQRGSNMTRVSEDLLAQGAISGGVIYRLGADYTGKNPLLKAGSYRVPEQASMAEIVEIVTRGGASTCGTEVNFRIGVSRSEVQVRELDPGTNRFVEVVAFSPADGEVPARYEQVRNDADTRYRVTLAEGATSWQIVNALQAVDFLFGEVAKMPGEGRLAPDSYEVMAGADRTALLERMQVAQAIRLQEAWQNRADGLPIGSADEALVLASIVEKETGLSEERAQVASVFVNRLRRGMPLQSDPTVIYGVTNGQSVLGRGLRQSELRRVTPFNTYLIDGLPPTPIANPGLEAIEATLNPADTGFIFFVADGNGGHAFAATLAEHNRNVAAWREIEASRGGG